MADALTLTPVSDGTWRDLVRTLPRLRSSRAILTAQLLQHLYAHGIATRQDLAEHLGCGVGYLEMVARGERPVTEALVRRLVAFLTEPVPETTGRVATLDLTPPVWLKRKATAARPEKAGE
jgi:hypothetical protein